MAALGLLMVVVVSCTEEGLTGVGADLMGPGVRTFEVTLDASRFLVRDTAFDRIGTLNDAVFHMAAHQFEGVLDARTLLSLRRPLTVSYTMDDEARTDTIAALVGGTLTLVVDTIASGPGPIDLEVLQVTEEWHRESATWTVRLDTADLRETWATPGGSPGPVLGGGTWTSGDTLRILMDSAAVAVWDDTAAARVGGLVRVASPDTRIFFEEMSFEFDVTPMDVDTVVTAGSLVSNKIILTPEQDAEPAPGVLRVGGLPAWRSMLRFQALDDAEIPCGPGEPADCTIPVRDVTINKASLVLHPVLAGPRRVEQPMYIEGRAVLQGPGVTLVRAPLTPPIGTSTDPIMPSLFVAPAPDSPVQVPITGYVRSHADPDEQAVPLWLALTALGERGQFGYAAFGGVESDRPPRLRLMVSVPDQELVR